MVALATLNFERTGLGAGAGAGFRLSTPGGKRAMKQLQETSVGEYVKAVRARARSFGTNSSAMIGGSVSALVTLAREFGHEQDPAVRQEIVRAHTLAASTAGTASAPAPPSRPAAARAPRPPSASSWPRASRASGATPRPSSPANAGCWLATTAR